MAEPSNTSSEREFQPYIPPQANVAELTPKSILLGAFFGLLFGAATVYLALKAGLTVSASIPIAVLAISVGQKLLRTTILENNIIQTAGSAGESIAAGVVFTLCGFLFLSPESGGAGFFNYWTIFALALCGGILGTLMMIPLRRSLIVKEHGVLPYPEGTACASVLIAGDKGGSFAKTAYLGVGFAVVYALLQKIVHVVAEAPKFALSAANKYLPSATINGEITPEYMGVGYIIGPRIAGVLVAGGVLAWVGLIPLLSWLVPPDVIAAQLVKLGLLESLAKDGAKGTPGAWVAATHTFGSPATAIYRAYIRQIGAGAVAAGGFITLLKTLPTIISSFRDSLASLRDKAAASIARTERDLSVKVVAFGSLGLVAVIAVLPIVPGDGVASKLLLGVLVVLFGFFFVTVASRIVGIIGSSSNPISGMTIATLMGTCLVFVLLGWTGKQYEPMALVVAGMVCIAAANGGATSQDLKTGYIVGATPRNQQIALFVGAIAASLVIGLTVMLLDTPVGEFKQQGVQHMIGTEKFSAPQGTLMATLIKGLLSSNLDWTSVMVGVVIAVTMELCGVKALSFAVGLYLPLSTTLPIFCGGMVKGLSDTVARRKGEKVEDSELGNGSLFATGLVAGGALMGVIVALVTVIAEKTVEGVTLPSGKPAPNPLEHLSLEESLTKSLGDGGYQVLGALCFVAMGLTLFLMSRKPSAGDAVQHG